MKANAYIVLGVKKYLDGSFELWGIEEDDDAKLQDVASSLLEPTPRFMYQAIPHDGVILGLITIPAGQANPVAPKKTEDPGFVEGNIYFRRGSKNDVASMQEQTRIFKWFRDGAVTDVSPNPYALNPPWARYLAEVERTQSCSSGTSS